MESWAHKVKTRSFSMSINVRHVLAELIGMALFVYIGTGAAVFFSNPKSTNFVDGKGIDNTTPLAPIILEVYNNLTINSSFGIVTALAFGMGILVSAYAIGHVSGCHLNPAVTISLLFSGNCGLGQAVANIMAQLAGSTLGSLLLWGTSDLRSSGLGANSVSAGFSSGNAFLGELVMTLFLCYVVHLTAVDPRNAATSSTGMAPLAIGFAVFLGHAVLIPLDGCSINPARSFGPALVANRWTDYWIFVVGPIAGALLAVPIFYLLAQPWEERANAPAEESTVLENIKTDADV